MDVMVLVTSALFLAGGLVLLVRMFTTGLLWGLGGLLVAPAVVPLYILIHWERARGPLYCWLAAFAVILVRVFAFSQPAP